MFNSASILLNRQPGLIIEKVLINVEKNINSAMRKILGVEGDTDYEKISIKLICETKECAETYMCEVFILLNYAILSLGVKTWLYCDLKIKKNSILKTTWPPEIKK